MACVMLSGHVITSHYVRWPTGLSCWRLVRLNHCLHLSKWSIFQFLSTTQK
ncbi:hypothetical protein BD777DRAFT_1102 [Yarrowia lipolytica]|nr:hypothetical protein BD777DRAFT_1102 [Yarrowia lipolytica]